MFKLLKVDLQKSKFRGQDKFIYCPIPKSLVALTIQICYAFYVMDLKADYRDVMVDENSIYRPVKTVDWT